jgi:hypothetical protein
LRDLRASPAIAQLGPLRVAVKKGSARCNWFVGCEKEITMNTTMDVRALIELARERQGALSADATLVLADTLESALDAATAVLHN